MVCHIRLRAAVRGNELHHRPDGEGGLRAGRRKQARGTLTLR